MLRLVAAALLAVSPLWTPLWTVAVSPAETVCTVDDPRAIELSGLVATGDGYVAVIDSQFDQDTIRVVYLDGDCRVSRTQGYPTPARDPEDIAAAPDGTLWVADIGDNVTAQSHRSTIALWRLQPNGGAPVIHRLSYPDGPHDAEALLFDATGPVIVTKELSGVSGLYRPTGPLRPDTPDGVPLTRVGEFRPTATDAPNSLGRIGEILVTGAATAPDRRRVALRTYTTAYEWDVPDGDAVRAITSTSPRVTPLPDEPQGESIAYTVDGRAFLTLSDVSGPTTLLRYQPSTVVSSSSSSPSPGPSPAATAEGLAGGSPDWQFWAAVLAVLGGLVTLSAVGIRALVLRRGGG